MKLIESGLLTALQSARDDGIEPAWFLWVVGKNRTTGADEPMGLWSGDEDITINVETPQGGLTSRAYVGGSNLSIDGITYVADLTDNPVSVSLSQIADATQALIRGRDVKLAYCEIHATCWNGGALVGPPQIEWIGVVDGADIGTPAANGDGQIALSVRSELMVQLTTINPAKSSDSHQRKRLSTDTFSGYAGTIQSRPVQGYKE